jgi:hypothetical protein
MNRYLLCAVTAAFVACAGDKPRLHAVSKEPVSVRGWIEDIEGGTRATNPDVESARRTQLFQATQIWVENAEYVSGGVAQNGSFILLDVPPGNVTIGFRAPGVDSAKLVLQNIPGNADVLIPAIVLKTNGASVSKPENIRLRVAAQVAKPAPTGRMAVVSGVQVPIITVPIGAMINRRDYPQPDGFRPVATFK